MLFAPDSSSKAYRQTLRKTSPPFIPYVGLALSDLVFMETGNPDYFDNIAGFINFKKCELLSKVRTHPVWGVFVCLSCCSVYGLSVYGLSVCVCEVSE